MCELALSRCKMMRPFIYFYFSLFCNYFWETNCGRPRSIDRFTIVQRNGCNIAKFTDKRNNHFSEVFLTQTIFVNLEQPCSTFFCRRNATKSFLHNYLKAINFMVDFYTNFVEMYWKVCCLEITMVAIFWYLPWQTLNL